MRLTANDLQPLPCIHEGQTTLLYRMDASSYARPVVIKVSRSIGSFSRDTIRFANEFAMTRSLRAPGIRSAYEQLTIDGSPALVLPYVEGETIADAFIRRRHSLGEMLTVLIDATDALIAIHKNGIIHRNISSSHILVGCESAPAVFIDFGLASDAHLPASELASSELTGESLAYISPEQTGRTSQTVDYRTDLYSLGVVFYEVLTGQLPFTASCVSELIHSHFAKRPRPVCEATSSVPTVLSDIVMTLLAKSSQERYQSAYGLRADLVRCHCQLMETGNMESFELASEDRAGEFQIPQTLYGRETELATITRRLDDLCDGHGGVVLITGGAGIGKSSFLRAIHDEVVKRHGYYLIGKCELSRKNVPYHALVQAFSGFVDHVLTETSDQLAQWKSRLVDASEQQGAALVELIPRLELIIGEHQPRASLASLKQFHHTIEVLAAIIAKRAPLVIAIDDLQWADVALLNLIELLVAGEQAHRILFIATYLSDEGSSDDSVFASIARRTAGRTVSRIRLEGISVDAVTSLVADALRCGPSHVESLAKVIHEKTGGNPLFAVRFLQSLHDEGLLNFDTEAREWKWDSPQIATLPVRNNVAQLMAREIGNLPSQTQLLLAIASCIGSNFDLGELVAIAQQPTRQVLDDLWNAIDKQLIVPLDRNYQIIRASEEERRVDIESRFAFVHERVRQACNAILGRKTKKEVHLEIGRAILAATSDADLETHVFDIVNHLNEGFPYIQDPSEMLELVELNWMAGRKAKRAAAFQAAIWYLSMGIGMLPADKWRNETELAEKLYLESAEAEYLSGNFERVSVLAKEILQNVHAVSTKIAAYELEIATLTAQGRFVEAIEAGVLALDLLDAPLPREPAKIQETVTLLTAEIRNQIVGVAQFLRLHPMRDECHLGIMRVLIKMAEPARRLRHELWPLIATKMVHLVATQGTSRYAAFAAVWYAIWQCESGGDIERGFQFGRVALELQKRLDSPDTFSKISFLFNVFVRPWKEHVKRSVAAIEDLYRAALASADQDLASRCANELSSHLLFLGIPLESAHQRETEYLETLAHSGMPQSVWHARVCVQTILNLQGASRDPCRLIGDQLDESEMLPVWIAEKNEPLVFQTLCCRTMLQYLFGDYAGAVESACQAEKYWDSCDGHLIVAEFDFYHALALLAQYPDAGRDLQAAYLQKVAAIQERLECWAAHAPMNFSHKWDLIEAERCRILGNPYRAMALYGNAIAGARENGYLHEEAIAYERETRFHLAIERNDLAGLCAKKAADGYRFWGAIRKADAWQEANRRLWVTEQPTSLDLGAIINASHMLSQEIRLEQLLDRMIHIVIENAGAEKGVLIENAGDGQLVQATGEVGVDRVMTMQAIPIEQSEDVPISIIHYVARTQTPVILNDAAHDGTYAADPYIQRHQTKSLLCLPIMHQSRLAGLLYLENNLSTNVFTEDRVELLKALASQAAISMENAALYADLEKSIRELRRAEEESRSANERYESILRSAIGSAIIGCDPNGIIQVFNEGAELMLGYSADEVIGKTTPILFHDPAEIVAKAAELHVSPDFNVFVHTLQKGRVDSNEWTYIRKDGSRILVQLAATIRRDSRGNTVGYVGIASDITDRRRAEDALRSYREHLEELVKQRTSELTAAKEAAEAANRAKSTFLATMSHEIRTPMTAILGYADLLMDPMLGPKSRGNYAATIRRSGEHLLSLLSDILDLSKIEAGKMSLSIGPCRIVSLLGDVVSLERPPAEQRGLSLSVNYLTPVPETIQTDAARLRQSVLNLVSNAIKFTEKGEVQINVAFQPGSVESHPTIKLEVLDTGIGISEEILPHLFQAFSQGDDSVSRKYGGTGLGLAISRHTANLLGGNLTVRSELGKGSCFTLTIPTGDISDVPILPNPREIMAQDDHPVATSETADLRGVRVLLAEDGIDNRQLIQTILQQAGAFVETAENGLIAVEMAAQRSFDVILVDINMPVMDGYQATHLLRDQGFSGPILALTANAMAGDRERCLAAGCDDHLAKPINRSLFIRTITTYAMPRLAEAKTARDEALGSQQTETTRQAVASAEEIEPSTAGTALATEPMATPEANEGPALRSEFRDDPDMATIVQRFIDRLQTNVDAMRAKLVSHEHRELQRLAHTIKGAGGSYGYPQLTEACKVLEDAAKATDEAAEQIAFEQVVAIAQAIQRGRDAG
jgi:PAS domain S-box-containing protein